ncbi:unnamed protein product [Blepharisma stoltei]|uniref:Uncharacterized protein n=1 Tax=Blepharisma stoltei TaxID=1481888 RepID=A0AAU9K4G3_9CILI|nr:unnamed protein product [Blepharisma stoltei]
MAPPPQDLDFTLSCKTLYRDSILITSYFIQKMIIYSIIQNKYQEIPNLVLNANYHKFMLKGNNRVYLFEKGGRIFESSENNILSWNQLWNNNLPNNNPLQSSAVQYKCCLYFVHYKNELWKFDLASKRVSQVATF